MTSSNYQKHYQNGVDCNNTYQKILLHYHIFFRQSITENAKMCMNTPWEMWGTHWKKDPTPG